MRKYRGTSDLRPEFDSRGSFYGKATIVDFDNGDKMRINEVKSILQDFFIALTEKNKGKQ